MRRHRCVVVDVILGTCQFVYGHWADLASELSPWGQNEFQMILSAEGIYRPEYFAAFTDLLERNLARHAIACVLVSAKRYYFGLGGGSLVYMETVNGPLQTATDHTNGTTEDPEESSATAVELKLFGDPPSCDSIASTKKDGAGGDTPQLAVQSTSTAVLCPGSLAQGGGTEGRHKKMGATIVATVCTGHSNIRDILRLQWV